MTSGSSEEKTWEIRRTPTNFRVRIALDHNLSYIPTQWVLGAKRKTPNIEFQK